MEKKEPCSRTKKNRGKKKTSPRSVAQRRGISEVINFKLLRTLTRRTESGAGVSGQASCFHLVFVV
jgi:hypothetical protein